MLDFLRSLEEVLEQMKEEKVVFPSGSLRLEGYYAPASSGRGALVAHPHPLMGGSLDNPVVEAIVAAFARQGYATLRFNFRGVGGSEGSFDDGRGEQDDFLAAADSLHRQGVREIFPAGYSFGAWVIAGALRRREELRRSLLVSPPLALMDFDFSGLDGRIGLMIAGDRDPYCAAELLRKRADGIGAPVRILAGADHFYSGSEGELAAALAAFFPEPA
jgi:alpha/beta superfamily hydrolase